MVMVQTVLGAVSGDDLGTTLMHEHVFTLDTEVEDNYPQGWDEEVRVAEAAATLRNLKRHGVDTIVDLTVLGLGRNIPRLHRIAEQCDVHIVVATGLYTYNDLPMRFRFQDPDGPFFDGPDPLIDLFAGDITEGIANTGVRAGMLKCATDEPGFTPGVVRVLKACAQVHRRTGTPITTHSLARERQGLEQQRLLGEAGVDLHRVVIGHSGDSTDLDYLCALMEAGSTIGMDRFGLDNLVPFEQRVQTVARLCAQGYAPRMVLSQDACAHFRWLDEATLKATVPNWHYTHVVDDVVPALRRQGVTQAQLDDMLVHAPRRILESHASVDAAPALPAPGEGGS